MHQNQPRTLAPRSRRRAVLPLCIIAVPLALAVGGYAAFRSVASDAKSATASAPHGAPLRLRFQPGTELTYAIAWSGEQRGRLFPSGGASNGGDSSQAGARADVALTVQLDVERVVNDVATLALRIVNVEKHTLEVLGGSLFPSQAEAEAALIGKRARVLVGSDGTARSIEFESGAPDVMRIVVQWIVAQSSMTLGPSDSGDEWTARERGPFGLSEVRYRREAAGVSRERVRYVAFDGLGSFGRGEANAPTVRRLYASANAVINPDGLLAQLDAEEAIAVDGASGERDLDGTMKFAAKLLAVGRFVQRAETVAFDPQVAPGEPVAGETPTKELLDQRIAGLTREQLMHDLATYGNAGIMPEHTKWLWRVTGLLKRDPKIADELRSRATARDATDKARALVLDLLASVGTPEAQKAMRDVLSSKAVTQSAARTALVQRVSFLEAPERETVDLVWDNFREARKAGNADLEIASAHALAAASTRATAAGDSYGARQLVDRLGDEVHQATGETAAALLGALGNASEPSVVGIARPYASSEDPDMREASAESLRKVATPDATQLLLGLLGDASPMVQSAALASLSVRTLDANDWRAISALVLGGRLSDGLDGAMLNLASAPVGEIEGATRVVAWIAEHEASAAATRARARAMLVRVGG